MMIWLVGRDRSGAAWVAPAAARALPGLGNTAAAKRMRMPKRTTHFLPNTLLPPYKTGPQQHGERGSNFSTLGTGHSRNRCLHPDRPDRVIPERYTAKVAIVLPR